MSVPEEVTAQSAAPSTATAHLLEDQLPADGDLFDLADALAELAGGPVTIEDPHHRLLAYSSDQSEVDQDRIDTILRRKAPDSLAQAHELDGSMSRLRRSDRPVFFDAVNRLGRNALPRVAISIRAGAEMLGTIWVVSKAPLGAERDDVLAEGARLAATLLAERMIAARRRAHLTTAAIEALTEGGDAAIAAAEEFGLSSGPFVVVAMQPAPHDRTVDPASMVADRGRILNAFAVHVGARFLGLVSGTIGSTLFAVIPVAESSGAADVAACCRGFVERDSGRMLRVAISGPVPTVPGLADARREAVRALGVLTATPPPQVVLASDVMLETWISVFREALELRETEPLGAYAALRAADQERGTTYLATVDTWLECHGDVTMAAARMHLHHNTFRYRLARIAELFGVDLGDRRTRFEIELQLRLFGRPG